MNLYFSCLRKLYFSWCQNWLMTGPAKSFFDGEGGFRLSALYLGRFVLGAGELIPKRGAFAELAFLSSMPDSCKSADFADSILISNFFQIIIEFKLSFMDRDPNCKQNARPPSSKMGSNSNRAHSGLAREPSSRIHRLLKDEADLDDDKGDENGPEIFQREQDQYIATKFRGGDEKAAKPQSGHQSNNKNYTHRRQSENVLNASPNNRKPVTLAKNPSQQHQSEAPGLGLSNSGLVSNGIQQHVYTAKTDSIAHGRNPSSKPHDSHEQTTNKTDPAGHVQSPIRQKADSSNGADIMVGQGSQESADIVLGENANIEHYLQGIPKKFGAIPEQDGEGSSPNVRFHQNEQPNVNLDMDNFVLLSERQRAEQIGEAVNLDQSCTPLKEMINEDLMGTNFERATVSNETEGEVKKTEPILIENTLNKKASPSNKSIGQINEQVIFSRLPQNYFTQEPEDPGNFENAIHDIQQMRQGFMAQLSESGMEEHLQEINDILQPQRFIEQCFGQNEKPADFMFNEIIREVPSPPRRSNMKQKKDPQSPEMKEFVDTTRKIDQKMSKIPVEDSSPIVEEMRLPSKKSNEKKRAANLWDADIASDPVIEETQPRFGVNEGELHQRQIHKPPIPQVYHQTEQYQELLRVKADDEEEKAKAKEPIKPPPSHRQKSKTGQKLISQTREPVKKLHMADYFTMPPKEQQSINSDLTKDEQLSVVTQTENLRTLDPNGALSPESILAASAEATKINSNEDCVQQDESEQEDAAAMAELDKKLEQDILDNVDINFVFNKGRSLAQGLLDPDRIYNVMSKLKEIAMRQLEQGSKEINYQEIVDYVKSKESIFGEEIAKTSYLQQEFNRSRDEDDLARSLAREPPNIVGRDAAEEDRRWTQCVGFLRNNPKLLLQMIPSEIDDINEMFAKQPIKRSKAFEKIKDAQRFNSRQHNALRQFQTSQKQNQTFSSTNRTYDKVKQEKTKKMMQPSTQAGTKLNTSQGSKKSSKQVQQWASYGQIDDKERERSNSNGTRWNTVKDSIRSSTERNRVNVADTSKPFSPNEPLSRISKVSDHTQNERVLSAFTNNVDPQRQTSNLNQIMEGAKRLQASYDFQKAINRRNLPEAMLRQQKRPTTASDFNQAKKFKKNLASNSILQMNMLSRSSVRQNHFATQLPTHHNGQGSSLSGTRSSPRVAPNLPPMSIQNQSAFLPAPPQQQAQSHTATQQSEPQLQQKHPQPPQVPIKRTTYNARHMKRNDKSTLPYTLNQSQTIMGSKKSNRSPRTQNYQPKTMINQKAGVLQFYPQERPKEATSPKRLLKVKGRRQKIQSKEQREADQPTIENVTTIDQQMQQSQMQQSQMQDNSILGDAASSEANSTVILDVKEGQQLSPSPKAKKTTAEPIPYMMKSSRTESVGEPDEKLLDSCSVPVDPLKLPLINQQANLPIRFDDQSTHQPSDGKHLSSFEENQDSQLRPDMTLEQAQGFIDWAYTPLCVRFLKKETEFNFEKDIKLFVESELDYVIDMMRSKFKDFERTEIMRPFYLKALSTLRNLLLEQHMDQRFQQLYKQYREITIENTLKLLLRCKLAFHTRGILLRIFQLQLSYELTAHDMKQMLDSKTSYKLRMDSFNAIREAAAKMSEAGQKAIQAVNVLRQDKKSQYKSRFVFKRRDLVKYIKNEVSEVKRLVMIFRPKRVDESSDSDEPCRMVADPEVQLEQVEHDRADAFGEHGRATISKVTCTEHTDNAIKGYQSGVSVIE